MVTSLEQLAVRGLLERIGTITGDSSTDTRHGGAPACCTGDSPPGHAGHVFLQPSQLLDILDGSVQPVIDRLEASDRLLQRQKSAAATCTKQLQVCTRKTSLSFPDQSLSPPPR